jgi:hypothetical protein
MNQTNRFGASAPLAGYIFQCRLALLRGLQLLKKYPNGLITIEKYDDIAFEDDDYGQCLMQAKHHVEPKPLTDMSVDLWKTIRVWLESFDEGSLTADQTRRFLITTATAEPASAMAKLRPGHSEEDRGEALSLLRVAAATSLNVETKAIRQRFLELTDGEGELFLQSIEVYDQHPNLVDMLDEIEGELILLSPENKGLIAQYLEGWWLGVVGEHLIQQDADPIPVQNIIIKANEIGNWFKAGGLPVDDPDALGAKDYTPDDEDAIFVRQMRLIGLSDTAVRRGARDFYRASAQRSRWARESLLLDGETAQYDAKLQDRWARRFDADCAECAGNTDEEDQKVGRSICFWATQEQIGFRNVVETWITAGSFHGLADRLEVGWHPRFQDILGSQHG